MYKLWVDHGVNFPRYSWWPSNSDDVWYLHSLLHSEIIPRAFQSGFETEPVMCQTVNTFFDKNYCPWVSCGEWCLTKTTGFCPQMHATTRRNGTEIQLENCTRITTTACPEVILFHSDSEPTNCLQCARSALVEPELHFFSYRSRWNKIYSNRSTTVTTELNVHRSRDFSTVRSVRKHIVNLHNGKCVNKTMN